MTLPAPMPPASFPFDARPLVEPVDKATARAYVKQLRATGRAPSGMNAGAIIAIVVFAVFFFGVFGSVFAGIITTFATVAAGGGSSAAGLFGVVPVVMLVIILGAVGFVIFRAVSGGTSARWYRLDRFAQANGMTWHPLAEDPPLPGMIFHNGRARKATDVVRGAKPRFVEFGNYQYTTGSGKNETTHHWGYVAVKLSTPLPNIVLDATSNNGLFGSNLPTAFDRDQRLSLEGDFDRYFALYCPAGYETDALYLFTPDIMARFIDHAAALDVEIVDDWMFLYAKREISTLDPGTWAWLFSVVGALLDKFAQWERWRDERLSGAPAGSLDRMPVGPALGMPAPVGEPMAGIAAPGADDSAVGAGGAAGVGAGAPASLPFVAPQTMLRPPPGVAPGGRRLKRSVPWVPLIIFGGVFLLIMLGQFGVFAGIAGSFFR